jgi:tripartite-type tricarboxylate transporter receptor subunit TctC
MIGVMAAASMAAAGTAYGAPACPELAGQTITWIVPFGPGGGYDVYSRLIEPQLEAALGAEIAVTNVEGAGGVIGTKRISEAEGDGLMLGLVNGAGLVGARLAGDESAPDLGRDLTVLATLTSGDRVWLVRADGPIGSVEDLLRIAEERPIIFPISDAGGAVFVGSAIGAALLGFEHEFVAGYSGSSETALALLRDEGDVGDFELTTGQSHIDSGELRALMRPIRSEASDAVLGADLPTLAGDDGWAARRAAALGRDVAQARRQAVALAEVANVGRVIVGPRDLRPEVAACLEKAIWTVLTDTALVDEMTRAKRPITARDAATTRAALEAIAPEMDALRHMLQEALTRLRS